MKNGLGKSGIIRDPGETLRELLPELRKTADLIVLLSDLGLATERTLLKDFPDISFVLGGHEGGYFRGATWEGRTAIFQSYQDGKYLGQLNLVLARPPGAFFDEGRVDLLKEAITEAERRLGILQSGPRDQNQQGGNLDKSMQELRDWKKKLEEN